MNTIQFRPLAVFYWLALIAVPSAEAGSIQGCLHYKFNDSDIANVVFSDFAKIEDPIEYEAIEVYGIKFPYPELAYDVLILSERSWGVVNRKSESYFLFYEYEAVDDPEINGVEKMALIKEGLRLSASERMCIPFISDLKRQNAAILHKAIYLPTGQDIEVYNLNTKINGIASVYPMNDRFILDLLLVTPEGVELSVSYRGLSSKTIAYQLIQAVDDQTPAEPHGITRELTNVFSVGSIDGDSALNQRFEVFEFD